MNHCSIQQNAFTRRDEMRPISVSDRRDTVVCPKPRRIDLDHPVRSLRWYASHQVESKSGADLLDCILTKGGFDADQSCANPFFTGSPPSRVGNPLTQDAQFKEERIPSLLLVNVPSSSPVSAAPPRKGGCALSTFGNKPMVRVEGFDCHNRDRRNRSIPTFA